MKKKINSSRIHKVSNAKSISTKKGNRSIMKNRLPKKSLRRKNSSSKKSLRKKIGGSKKRTVRGKNVKRTLKKLRGGSNPKAPAGFSNDESARLGSVLGNTINLEKRKLTPGELHEMRKRAKEIQKTNMIEYINQNKNNFLKDDNTITFNLMRYGFKLSEEDDNDKYLKKKSSLSLLQEKLNNHVEKYIDKFIQKKKKQNKFQEIIAEATINLSKKGYKKRYKRLLKVCSYFFNKKNPLTDQKISNSKLLNIFYNIFFYRDGKNPKTKDYSDYLGPYISSNKIKSTRGYRVVNYNLGHIRRFLEAWRKHLRQPENFKPYFLYYLIFFVMRPENVSTLNHLTNARPPAAIGNNGNNGNNLTEELQREPIRQKTNTANITLTQPASEYNSPSPSTKSAINTLKANQGLVYNSRLSVEDNASKRVANPLHQTHNEPIYSVSVKIPKIALINFGAINDSPLEFESQIAVDGEVCNIADIQKNCAKYFGKKEEEEEMEITEGTTITISDVIKSFKGAKMNKYFESFSEENFKKFINSRNKDGEKNDNFDSNSLYQLLGGPGEADLGISDNVHGGKIIAGLEGQIPVDKHPFKSLEAFKIAKGLNEVKLYEMINEGIEEAFLKRMEDDQTTGSTLGGYYFKNKLYGNNDITKSQVVYGKIITKINENNGEKIKENVGVLYNYLTTEDDDDSNDNIKRTFDIDKDQDQGQFTIFKNICSYYRILILGIYFYFVFISLLLKKEEAKDLENIMNPEVGITEKDKYGYINKMIEHLVSDTPDFIFLNEGLPVPKETITGYELVQPNANCHKGTNEKKCLIYRKDDSVYSSVKLNVQDTTNLNHVNMAEHSLIKVKHKNTSEYYLHCIHNSSGIKYSEFKGQLKQLKDFYRDKNFVIGIDSNCDTIINNPDKNITDLTNFQNNYYFPEPNPNKKKYEATSSTHKKRSLFQSQAKYEKDCATKDFFISNDTKSEERVQLTPGTIYKKAQDVEGNKTFPFDHFVLLNYDIKQKDNGEPSSGDPLLIPYQIPYMEGDYKLTNLEGKNYQLEVLTNGEFVTYILDKNINNPFDIYTIQMKGKEEKINTGIDNIGDLIEYLKDSSQVNMFEQTLHNKIE